jgi:hypothetical protein
MEFLKKHYEKIVLCVILLGLAAAVVKMKSALEQVKTETDVPVGGAPPRTAPPKPIDLSTNERALAQVTNPPPLVLTGDHNLFNAVTWKRMPNGTLMKILKTGVDALEVTNIVPHYMILSYERAMEGPIFVMNIKNDVDLNAPVQPRGRTVYPRKDERRTNSWPFVVRGIKGAEDDPSEINLEIIATGDTNVWVSKEKPYQQVGSYTADLKYDPDPSLPLRKLRVTDKIRLDNEPYIIVDITNDAVKILEQRNSRISEIKWTNSLKGTNF